MHMDVYNIYMYLDVPREFVPNLKHLTHTLLCVYLPSIWYPRISLPSAVAPWMSPEGPKEEPVSVGCAPFIRGALVSNSSTNWPKIRVPTSAVLTWSQRKIRK